MKKPRVYLSRVISTVLLLSGTFCWLETPLMAEEIQVDSLSDSVAGEFPKGWKTYPFHSGKAHRVYQVQAEGSQKFIQAKDAEDISVPIFKDFDWDLNKYPYLKFRWRAQQLPAGAKENSRATNDSACGVYVGFGRASALKYVWSSTLPVGSFWEKDPGKFMIIAKASGPGALATWQNVTVNVPKDFREYFKKDETKTPSGIGVMTDGNAMHQPAACDYSDFRISTSP